jgi:uncharacterized protein
MAADYFSLATGNFFEDWSDASDISVDDNWAGVQSIVGYRGDGLTSSTGVNPTTVSGSSSVVDVNANRSDPSVFATGGVAEFDGILDRTVAIQGSGTARAPYIVVHLDATGRENLVFSTRLRDIDTGTASAQPIAIQYRVGDSGPWLNVTGGFLANANIGTDTLMSVALPAAVNGEAQVQVRVITTDAGGSDAFIGIDDIGVSSQPITIVSPGVLGIADATVAEGDSGTSALTFTVSRTGGDDGAVGASWTIAFGTANAADLGAGQPLSGSVAFADGETSKTVIVQVAGDTDFEPDETFTVTLSAPTGGATLGDSAATGTIVNDDGAPTPGAAFINEIHYDNTSADTGERIEIAGPGGLNLTGWSLVLYNGNGGASYATIPLGGAIPDQDDGYGTLSFNVTNIQNGAPDGVALVDNLGQVVQFLSYEGSFTATNGPASGMTSTDIGVAEEPVPGAGFSLQLVGSGASYQDFAWIDPADDSFGVVNQGQDFIGADADGLIRVADSAVSEGDDNSHDLVFTVTRAGGLAGSGSVDYMLAFGTASPSDIDPGTPLSGTISFAPGETSKQVVIGIVGDTVGEGNETLSLTLSNPTGAVVIDDGAATGTILNDDPIALRIFEIQGAGHESDYAGQAVITDGIVTAVDSNGFYLQDQLGDGDDSTSDGVFVFTGSAPTVAVGAKVEVQGTVAEFLPGGDPASLTITEIENVTVTPIPGVYALPAATLIGTGGRLPPTAIIDNDGMSSYDPATDGIDFYESLEGMRVTVDSPQVVSSTTNFGETFVVASGGAGATGMNGRGGITISDGDLNPERIQLDDDAGLFAGYAPAHSIGDTLGDVTGIVSYSFSSYEVLVTQAVAVADDVTVSRETTALDADIDHLAVATYNVENLDPTDPQAKFDLLAGNIVYNLSAPDIVAVQEIQDADGAGNGSNLSGAATAQKLIDAIAAAGGPDYLYVEIAPATAGSTGGEPGGNIRNGYLYNPDRVSYVAGSAELVPGSAFNGTRSPLAADFSFNGQTITLINVHFTSRGGSDPLFGANQPPADAGDTARTNQATAVRAYIDSHLADDASLHFGVLGDYNGFYFENAIETLTAGGVLTDLHGLLPVEERYSYVFEGNSQAIDHILVTGGLAAGAQYDAVHINAEQTPGTARGTDHDPQLALFLIPEPNDTPTNLVIDDDEVAENMPAGTLVGTISADDLDGDTLTYTLVDSAGGRFALDPSTGALTTTAVFDHESAAGYTIVARATDPDGASVEATIAIAVTDVNEAPSAADDATAVDEDATTANLWSALLANDTDPDDGDSLAIAAVDTTGTLGTVLFDADDQTLHYVADDDAFDALAPGATMTDSFAYTVTDEDGLTSTATVEVTVTGVADGVRIDGGNGGGTHTGTDGEDVILGGNGKDTLNGLGGHDLLMGGNGADLLFGGDGNDFLYGENGDDRLDGGDGQDLIAGGRGNDRLDGGEGGDVFRFGQAGGHDVVGDFDTGSDRILLDEGIALRDSHVTDANGDGDADLVLAFTHGTTVTLLGVGDLGAVQFGGAEILTGQPVI